MNTIFVRGSGRRYSVLSVADAPPQFVVEGQMKLDPERAARKECDGLGKDRGMTTNESGAGRRLHFIIVVAFLCAYAAPAAKASLVCAFSSFTNNSGSNEYTFPSSGGSGSVSINFTTSSGCTWSVSATSFITISGPTSGSNTSTSVTIPFTVGVFSGEGQIGTITATVNGAQAGSQTVSQDGSACTVSFSPTSVNIPASGGSGSFTENAPGCGWWDYPNSPVSWVTLTTAPAGSGPPYSASTISYTVSANSGAARSAILTVSQPNAATFTINQAAAGATAPVLSISKAHAGNFTQGQTGATYTVTVSNHLGAAPTNGTVTVTETPPPGLTLVSMAGSGWTCAANACARSDVLAAGSTYPAITVTVNVTTSATSPQVNAVSVSGGGSGSASTTDSTIILPAAAVTCNPQSGTYTAGQQYSTTCTVSGEMAPVSWTFSALPPWLQISSMLSSTCTLSGTVPSPPPNSYSVTVTATGYPGTLPVPTASTTVTINVSTPTGTLGVQPTSLSYSVTSGVVPPPQNLTITSTSGTLSWNAATALTSSAPANWISASPTGGTASPGSPGNTAISILPIVTTFPTGTYTANVNISSGGQIKTAAVSMAVVQNDLVLNPTVMVFAAVVNSPAPPGQTLTVSTLTGGALSFGTQLTYQTQPPSQWLSVSPASTSAPTSLTVSVQPSGLSAGTYVGYVNLTATGSTTAHQVSVTLTVNPPNGTLGVQPASLSYSVTSGVVPPPQNLTITSTSGTLSWNAATVLTNSAPANWISASPTSGSASPGSPGTTAISILPVVTTFPTGTYTASVNITSGTQVMKAAVTMSVVQNYLVLTQNVMVFAALINAPGPPVQTLPVSTSAGTVSFSTQIQYPTPLPPSQWLSVSPASATAPTNLTVSVQPSGLSAGTYVGYVNLITTTTYQVSVTLWVKAAPDNTFAFNYQIGGALPAPVSVPITSNGVPISVLAGAGSDQNNWLSVSPTTAVTPANLILTASPGSLPAGQYQGTVAITGLYTDQSGTLYGVAAVYLVTLTIAPVATQTVQTISHIADGAGWSTSIILVNTGAQPASYTLQVTGDKGAAIAPSSTGLGMLSTAGTIPVGGSKIISTDGTAANLTEGWARVTSAQSIGGTAIFRSAQPKGSAVPYQEAAVPLLTAGSTTLLFPFDNNANLATGVALAAPDNNIMTTVSWRQRNQAGQNLTSSPEQPVTLPPFGHTALVLPIDSALSANLRGVAEFDSQNGPIFGLGIRSNSGAFTSVEAVTSQPAATKIISHIADGGTAANGGSWQTTIILVNTDTVAATFTVNLWQDYGTPFAVQLVGSSAQSVISGVIPVGGAYTIETADVASQTTTGWAEVLSSQSIGGTAVFRLASSGQEAAVPLLTTGGTKLMLPFDVGSGFALGVALANPSLTQDATITYTLRDETGNPIPNNPPQSISLPRHQHTSFVLPVNLNGAAELKGVVEFDSPNGAVFVLGIRANNGAFTSVRAVGQ